MDAADDVAETSGDPPATDATVLLRRAADGDQAAAEELMPLVFEQLRQAARRQLARERPGHTLSATALVNEAWIKLAGPRDVPWSDRRHFHFAAAEAMRWILVDHARARAAKRRGGPDARRAALDLASLPDPGSEVESSGFLLLHEAIERFEKVDEQGAEVVRLRYFGGLTIEQTAEALDVSVHAVKRTWAFARGWLREAIESERF